MGRSLCVLGEFRLNGREAEEALGLKSERNESYFLFEPTVPRSTGNNAIEQAVMSSCCSSHEEEIYIRDNVVVWSSGHLVRKRFGSPSPVLKVCWCQMESVSEPLLCVLHPNSLTTYTLSGEVSSVPFPHSMSSMWPSPWGLILKLSVVDTPYTPVSTVPPVSSSILKLPKGRLAAAIWRASTSSSSTENAGSVYFTVNHPLEEPEALHFEDFGEMRMMMDPAEQILWSSDKVPYIATYHEGRKKHTLWEMKYCDSQLQHNSGKQSPGFFYLQQLWQEKGEQPQATQVFMATDAEESMEPLVCFVEKEAERLFALKFRSDSRVLMDVAWTICAVSAVPIVASQSAKGLSRSYLLALAPDGNIFLYVGRYPLCTFTLPLLSNEEEKAEELFDAVGTNYNVLTSSGKVYRCSLNLTPSSGITHSCLLALAEGLRPIFYRYILSSYLDCYDTELNDLKRPDREDKEWTVFSGVIKDFIAKPKAGSHHPPRSSWDLLLQSSRHKNALLLYPCLRKNERKIELPFNEDKKTGYGSMLLEVLQILHMVYEDYKLDKLRWGQLSKLGLLLHTIAVSIHEMEYADHYVGDFPVVVPSLVHVWMPEPNVAALDHYTWIESILRRKLPGLQFPVLITNECYMSLSWSRKVLGFFEVLLESGADARSLACGISLNMAEGTAKTAEQRTVLAMVGEGFGLSHLDRLPCGISLPLRHAINNCRECPPTDWPSDAYILLGREDLAYMSASRPSSNRKRRRELTMAAPYMQQLRPTLSIDEREGADAREGQTNDGMEHMFSPTVALRFGSDLRLNEVRRVLCSSKHVAVKTSNTPDISDPDLVAQQQAQLWQLAQRTTALPFGRGAFTLSSFHPLLTEALQVPKLVLAGRLPSQHDAIVNLDVNAGNITELNTWPEFHNGVAAGLRLAPGQAKITRTWIVYNKPDEPSYEHAGFLMSLGLQKHLGALAATDVYRYLSQEHDPTTAGVLLGLAAAHKGTMDAAISKMLYLHIPARHPPSYPELELSSLLQSAALMAVGLLYQGSAHRLTTEILLAEIGRKPGSDSSLDREGYALAAGSALGLVTLGRGKDAWGLTDLKIEDRLLHYIYGGSKQTDEHCRRFDGASVLSHIPKNNDDVNQTGGQVLEGSIVNLDVTAPGATLALALMFMKTNDHGVAARLVIPNTHFALEYVRPDFILLRVVARNLILWDSVQASEDWVQSQIPDIVRQSSDYDAFEAAFDADPEALAQAHVNILAGVCLSIGLKYAGTASSEAQHLLYHYALYFLKEKSATASAATTTSNRRRVDKGTLETCLNVAVLSLSVVMAGTGHLETFKLFRYLRRRTDADIFYGSHMAISMAIGFLFLGGGNMTFSTSNAAVAALLISLYPRFPNTPSDHRCHLQVFRHLYVLAAEPRCVQTMDVDTGLLVYAPLEMTLRETNLHCKTSYSRVSPCILPERSALQRVRVCGPRYWSQDIQLGTPVSKEWWELGEQGDPFNGGVLYVKRKVGARSYADDPIGSRSLLSRVLQRVTQMNAGPNGTSDVSLVDESKVDELVGTFSSDPSLLAFAQQFCSNDLRGDFQEFCLLALFECVSMDKPALLQVYVELYSSVESLINRVTDRGSTMSGVLHICLSLQNIKVALAYCEAAGHDPMSALRGQSLVQRTFLASLAKRIDEVMVRWRYQEGEQYTPPVELVCYFTSHNWPSDSSDGERVHKLMFACYKCWDVLPRPSLVRAALLKLDQVMPEWRSMDSKLFLPILASLLPGTPTRTLRQVARCLPRLL